MHPTAPRSPAPLPDVPSATEAGFLLAERAEDLVARFLRITGMEARHETAVFYGAPLPGAASRAEVLESAFRERGLDLWLMEDGADRAVALVGPAEEKPAVISRPAWNALLLLATIVTTTWAGALHRGIDLLAEPGRWAAGVPYSVALLGILGIHELGHYAVARRRGVGLPCRTSSPHRSS